MLQSLIKQAESKAGSQKALASHFNVLYHRFGDYKAGRRIPSDELIGQLAEYVGMNPIEAIIACKLDTTDQEKATLWTAWLEKYWHSIGDSNPCYRRERAVLVLFKGWQGLHDIKQVIWRQMGIFLGGLNIAMTK